VANAAPTPTAQPDVRAEIRRLMAAIDDTDGAEPDAKLEKRLVRLRYEAYQQQDWPVGRPDWPPACADPFPEVVGRPPEVTLAELDAERLGGAIQHHGCLLVRGVITPGEADELARGIDRAFEVRDARRAGEPTADRQAWYSPFKPREGYPAFPPYRREWIRKAGGLLAADSPRLLRQLIDTFERSGLLRVIGDHLGEAPVLSVDKTTLRRVTPDKEPTWHQDGSFLASGCRPVNTWLNLTRCGGDAPVPGLDIVAARVDEIAQTGSRISIGVAQDELERVARGAPVLRPTFEPGDALLFDEFFLHRTATGPGMTDVRHAIETWAFAPSTFPDDYFPLVM
jgi:hypothetical protein